MIKTHIRLLRLSALAVDTAMEHMEDQYVERYMTYLKDNRPTCKGAVFEGEFHDGVYFLNEVLYSLPLQIAWQAAVLLVKGLEKSKLLRGKEGRDYVLELREMCPLCKPLCPWREDSQKYPS